MIRFKKTDEEIREIREIIKMAHEDKSNKRASEVYGVSRQTIMAYRRKYYKENPEEFIEFPKGGANNKAKEVKTIEDFPEKAQRIARYFSRNPRASSDICSKSLARLQFIVT